MTLERMQVEALRFRKVTAKIPAGADDESFKGGSMLTSSIDGVHSGTVSFWPCAFAPEKRAHNTRSRPRYKLRNAVRCVGSNLGKQHLWVAFIWRVDDKNLSSAAYSPFVVRSIYGATQAEAEIRHFLSGLHPSGIAVGLT